VGLALLSPLDRWGAQLFALHMVQHELLMLIAAPLLVLGRPLPMFLWAFDERARAGLARLANSAVVQSIWSTLLSPLVAWLLHALALWLWHVPRFFDAVLQDAVLHDVQHLSFLLAALVFWAAMIETRRQEQQGAAILYLFTTTIHTSVLGALITFATRPWYAAYLQIPRAWGLTALEDQQLGGLIMWVPGSLVYVGIALALLVRWIRASDSAVLPRQFSRNETRIGSKLLP
jgi:putative membrane protein